MQHFKTRWKITSNWQIVVIILVFALTGSTAAFISKPILEFFGITKNSVSVVVYYLFYVLIIFPVYQILLLLFGFLAGQFEFFKTFEKKMLRSLKLDFIIKFFEK
ncbi:MAG: diacylglyceryl transferase [Flavobacterium sp.]|nr:diacylglyceryl transferase [Flavobacterium sp.]